MAHIEDRWEKVVQGTRVRSDRYGKGERWRARYFDPNGQERARTFARKTDAEKFLAGVESDKSRGLYVDPSAGRITVGQYAATWQAAQVHRRTTEAAFDSHLRNHILPLLGHRPMGAVTRSEIQGWVKSRSAVLAPSTTTLVYSVLRMIFRSAVADRVIAVSPCERITLPKAPPSQVHPLPVEAVAALAEAVPDRYRALLVCAAGTGLRQGEVLGLRRDRVDFLRRMLTVDGQLVLMPGAPPYLAPPKTNASYRSVPMADVVLQALSRPRRGVPGGPHRRCAGPFGGAAVRRRPRQGAGSHLVPPPCLDSCGSGRRAADRHALSSAPAFLRLAADRWRRERQGRAEPAGARHRGRDAEHLRAPVAGHRGPVTDRRGRRLGSGSDGPETAQAIFVRLKPQVRGLRPRTYTEPGLQAGSSPHSPCDLRFY